MKKKRIVKVRGEGLLFSLSVMSLVAAFVLSFFFSTSFQSNNAELQRLKSKIESQEKINMGMQMKINELASLDNALEVADAFDLEYNNNNIRVVTE